MTSPVAFQEEKIKLTIYETIRLSELNGTVVLRETFGISVLRHSGMMEWMKMSLIDLAIADQTAGYSSIEHSAKTGKYTSMFASLVFPKDGDL